MSALLPPSPLPSNILFPRGQMMQSMHENNFQPTEAAFAMALMSAGRLGRTEFAKVLFEWRIASGLGPKQEIYSSVSFGNVGDVAAAFGGGFGGDFGGSGGRDGGVLCELLPRLNFELAIGTVSPDLGLNQACRPSCSTLC